MWLFVVMACAYGHPCDVKHALAVVRTELTGPMCNDRLKSASDFHTKPKKMKFIYWCEREADRA